MVYVDEFTVLAAVMPITTGQAATHPLTRPHPPPAWSPCPQLAPATLKAHSSAQSSARGFRDGMSGEWMHAIPAWG